MFFAAVCSVCAQSMWLCVLSMLFSGIVAVQRSEGCVAHTDVVLRGQNEGGRQQVSVKSSSDESFEGAWKM